MELAKIEAMSRVALWCAGAVTVAGAAVAFFTQLTQNVTTALLIVGSWIALEIAVAVIATADTSTK